MTLRRALAALLLTAALPALGYLLPAQGILRRMGERRAALGVYALEVSGTFQAEGPAAERLAGVGLGRPGVPFAAPARLLVKVPGRCRLELAPSGLSDAERPFVAVRDGKLSGHGGLEAVPAAVALVRAVCALLAVPVVGDASEAYAQALGKRGVALADATLGRFDGRIAYVLGGRARDTKPLVFVDKDAFLPLRLVSPEGGLLSDVRLLGWGSPTGGDWFPRAAEVWDRDVLRIRFTTEKAAANPKLADALF
jgi:hypothetical protein